MRFWSWTQEEERRCNQIVQVSLIQHKPVQQKSKLRVRSNLIGLDISRRTQNLEHSDLMISNAELTSGSGLDKVFFSACHVSFVTTVRQMVYISHTKNKSLRMIFRLNGLSNGETNISQIAHPRRQTDELGTDEMMRTDAIINGQTRHQRTTKTKDILLSFFIFVSSSILKVSPCVLYSYCTESQRVKPRPGLDQTVLVLR